MGSITPAARRCASCKQPHDDVGVRCQCMPIATEPAPTPARCLHDDGDGEMCGGAFMLEADGLLICTYGHRWELVPAGWVEPDA